MQKTKQTNLDPVLSDEQLVQIVQNGSPDAFNVLAARYIKKIRASAFFHRNGGLETEDLMQEGMIGLLLAVRSYDTGFFTSFSTFAGLCINRRILSAVKAALCKKQIPKLSVVSIQDTNISENVMQSTGEDPEAAFFRREDLLFFRKMIFDSLSPLERMVLAGFLNGESYHETAKRLKTSSKAVDNALWRIRRKLRCNVSCCF